LICSGEILTAEKINKGDRLKKSLDKIFDKYPDLKWLFDQTLNCIYIHDFQGNFLYANQKAVQLLGIEEKDINKINFNTILDREELPKAYKFTKEILETGSQKELAEYKLKRKDGKYVYVICEGFLLNKGGKPSAILGTAVDITDRKILESELRASEDWLLSLIETSSDWIWELDAKENYIYSSPRVKELLGYRPEEIIGRKPFDLMPSDAAKYLRETFLKLNQKQKPIERMSNIYNNINGSQVILETNAIPILENTGKVSGWRGIDRDITERVRTESLLSALNAASRSMQQALTTEAIFQATVREFKNLGFSLIITPVDPEKKRLYPGYMGYDSKIVGPIESLLKITQKNFSISIEGIGVYEKIVDNKQSIYIENNLEILKQILPQSMKRYAGKIIESLGLSKTINSPIVIENKVVAILHVYSESLRKEDVPAVTAFANQIAAAWRKAKLLEDLEKELKEKKLTEAALKESEEKYRAVMEQSIENIYIMDMKSKRVKEANPALRNLLGYTQEEIKKLKIYDFIKQPKDDVNEKIDELEEKRHIFVGERQYVCKDGRLVDVEVNASIINYLGKKAVCVVSRDITERKKSERVLRESESLFRSLFENNIIGIYRTTPEGRIIMANPALVKMLGYSSFQDLADRDLEKNGFEIGYSRQDFKQEIEEKGQVIGLEAAWKKNDGSILFIRESSRVIRDQEGKPLYYEGTIEDITERKKDEELIKASLREKEVLLREIHHRVKNNLQIITSLLRLQSSRVEEDAIQEMFKTAQSRIRTMALIHEKLYQSQDLSKIDLSQYIRNLSIHLLNIYRTDPEKVSLNIEIGDVFLDINTAIPCGLIINELVSNSLKYAFPANRSGSIQVKLDVDKKGKHILMVADDGVGLPEGLQVESTDTLGLQLVYDLTKQIQGRLTVEMKKGTLFRIVF